MLSYAPLMSRNAINNVLFLICATFIKWRWISYHLIFCLRNPSCSLPKMFLAHVFILLFTTCIASLNRTKVTIIGQYDVMLSLFSLPLCSNLILLYVAISFSLVSKHWVPLPPLLFDLLPVLTLIRFLFLVSWLVSLLYNLGLSPFQLYFLLCSIPPWSSQLSR